MHTDIYSYRRTDISNYGVASLLKSGYEHLCLHVLYLQLILLVFKTLYLVRTGLSFHSLYAPIDNNTEITMDKIIISTDYI